MSIKTDGLFEAGPFKVTATVPAGFVKNNALGELEFGQAASAWDLIEFKTFSGAGNFDDFAAVLDGNVDDTYQIMWQAIGQSSTNTCSGGLRINGVLPATLAVTRYISQRNFHGATAQDQGNSWRLWRDFSPASNKAQVYGRCVIHAKSGKIRTGESWFSSRRSFGATLRQWEAHFCHRWSDTTTNITSLGITTTFARVNRAWLYKIKTS